MTWRKNTGEEVEELRRFVDDMKRGTTPASNDSLLETLRQIHDKREAPPLNNDHRNMLLERLRRQMAEQAGTLEAEPPRVPTFRPLAKPSFPIRWALAASLIVHVGIGAAVLPNVEFNLTAVDQVAGKAVDDSIDPNDVIFLPLVVPSTVQVKGSGSEQASRPRDGSGVRQVVKRSGDPASPTVPGASTSDVVARNVAAPTAPARIPTGGSSAPLLPSFTPSDELGSRHVDDETTLEGPDERLRPFTEVSPTRFSRNIDTAPKILTTPRPLYSVEALSENIQGTVTISAVLSHDGTVQDAKVLRPLGHGLDEAAIRAVKQIRFEPATRNGVKVSAQTTIMVRFSLQ